MAKTSKKTESAPVAETVKETVKETVAVEAAAESKPAKTTKAKTTKTAAKTKAPKKAPVKKAAKTAKAPTVKVVLEYKGVQVSQDDVIAAVKADWAGEAIKSLEIYVKPEDAAAYYVVNGEGTGKVSF